MDQLTLVDPDAPSTVTPPESPCIARVPSVGRPTSETWLVGQVPGSAPMHSWTANGGREQLDRIIWIVIGRFALGEHPVEDLGGFVGGELRPLVQAPW